MSKEELTVVNDEQEEILTDDQEQEEDIAEELEEETIDNAEDEEELIEVEDDDPDKEVEDENIEIVDEDEESKPNKKNKPEQSDEDNSKYAAARRKAEKEMKLLTEGIDAIYKQAGIKSLSEFKKPTMTKERIEKLTEEAYNKGEDPDDYVKKVKTNEYIEYLERKEALEELEQRRKEEAKKQVEADKADFEKTYKMKAEDLLKDEFFYKFAKHQLGHKSLKEIKKDYDELVTSIRTKSVSKALSKSERATSSGNAAKGLTITKKQYADLQEWNRQNPRNKMTVKEFIRR